MARIAELLGELSDVVWDVILFSETRTSQATQILEGGHVLYTMLGDNAAAGVGVLVHAGHVKNISKI